ncbi:MAG TPA: YesL family protein [Lachnospiraceae bacterium]|nr:YesL family protein [Lachnospiraceae bacterium]
MKNIFSTDSKFYTIPAKIVDVLWLSILWIVCSIPIITIGASSCAMFYVTLKMCRDEEGGVTKHFFKAFKANFKQGTILWLIMLVVGIILGVNLVVCRQNETTFGIVLFMITTVLILWYLMELLYLFPVVARFENTVKRQLVFAFFAGYGTSISNDTDDCYIRRCSYTDFFCPNWFGNRNCNLYLFNFPNYSSDL